MIWMKPSSSSFAGELPARLVSLYGRGRRLNKPGIGPPLAKISFVARFLPQSTSSSTSSSSPRLAFHDRRGSTSSSGHVVERRGSTISATDAQSSSPPLPTLYLASFEEVQNAIQDMYEAARKLIEDAEKKRKSDENGDGGAAVTATEDFEDSNDLDGIVDRALERIEDEVCLQLYDQ
jgi:hypothetical protein